MRLDLRPDLALFGRFRGLAAILENRGHVSSKTEVTMSGLFTHLAAFPFLGDFPCPAFVAEALDGLQRRRELVLRIHAVAGKDAAFAALWLARGVALASWQPNGETIERVLRLCLGLAMKGGRAR